ncbi:MAG: Dephospho-CoA kinase [Candidatus Acidoferrum typicum]|nr:Dephospho-CoA kinase [Candidatus Acidoferrum typicum]
MTGKMLRLGLTGGIATGKTAVATMLRELRFDVLDADSLYHKLIEPCQPAYNEVVREFGPSVLDNDARVNRAKLAAIVFADPAKLANLNAILHPRVEAVIHQQFAEWAGNGSRDAAFVEAALLVEAGYQKNLDGLVVTWCRPEQQLERLRARGFSDEDAHCRIAAQLPVAEKLSYAREKIDCSGSLEETRRQVQALAAKLRNKTAAPQQ